MCLLSFALIFVFIVNGLIFEFVHLYSPNPTVATFRENAKCVKRLLFLEENKA